MITVSADKIKERLAEIHSKPDKERTPEEIEFLRTSGAVFGGCCENFADNKGCYCLTNAMQRWGIKSPESYTQAAEGIVGVPFTPDNIKGHSGNKYVRKIKSCITRKEIGEVDVYSVENAFGPMPMARSHALKKILCAGLRSKGDAQQDIKEAIDALKEDLKLLENS